MSKEPEYKRRTRESFKTEKETAKLLDRRKKEKPLKLGALGEPGRFCVRSKGKRTGVHHFST